MTDLISFEEALETFRENRHALEVNLMRVLETPTWINVIPLLDRIKELINEIELEIKKGGVSKHGKRIFKRQYLDGPIQV